MKLETFINYINVKVKKIVLLIGKITITEEMIPKEIFNIEEPRLSMPKPQKIRANEKITY